MKALKDAGKKEMQDLEDAAAGDDDNDDERSYEEVKSEDQIEGLFEKDE